MAHRRKYWLAPRASGASTRLYTLLLQIKSGRVYVREKPDCQLLPAFCPQRHMNLDGSFCLGLNAGHALADRDIRRKWWNKLHVFLTCQDTAWETRSWPASIELSHGNTSVTEVQSEEVAEELGLLEETQEAVRNKSGMIARAVDLINPAADRLRNGRRPCVCGRRGKNGRTKLRRECRRDGDICLVFLEAQRREEEISFWSALSGTHECCGTMNDCPLKEADDG